MTFVDADRFLGDDQGFEKVIKEITRCCQMDERVNDFYRLQTDPDFDSAEPTSILAKESDNSTIVETLEPMYYPARVLNQLQENRERQRIFLGGLDAVRRFFCVIDDTIYIWKMEKGENVPVEKEVKAVDNRVVTAVTVAYPFSKVYEKENAKHLLVYAAGNTITLIPFVEDDEAHGESPWREDDQRTFQLTNEVTAIAASSKEGDPTIFIGDQYGGVYAFKYSMSRYDRKTINWSLVSSSWLGRLGRVFSRTNNMFMGWLTGKDKVIREIVYEETTGYVAALDSEGDVSFFLYSNDKLAQVYTHENEVYPDQRKIIAMSGIPISDSQWTRFVCFDAFGGRWFFGTNPGVSENPDEIVLLGTNNMNMGFQNLMTFESCSCVLNRSIWVGDDFVVCMRPFFHPHEGRRNPEEEWKQIDLTRERFGANNVDVGKPVNTVRVVHNYRDTDKSPLFRNEFLWQHLLKPSDDPSDISYLMCTNGILPLRFLRPVDQLKTLWGECHKHLSEGSVKEWMVQYGEEAESAACALLLACEVGNEDQRKVLNELNDWVRKIEMYSRDSFDTRLSPMIAAFFVRTARLLSLIWHVPVFTKKTKPNKEVWVVSDIFTEMPDTVLDDLNTVKELATHAKPAHDSDNTRKETQEEQRKRYEEIYLLEHLKDFIEKETEILTFIQIMDKRAERVITQAINELDPETQRILCVEEFGSQQQNSILFNALRKFAAAVLKIDRHLNRELEAKCKTLFSHKDLHIIDVTNQLSDIGICDMSVLKLDQNISHEMERRVRTILEHEGVHIIESMDEDNDLDPYDRHVLRLDRHMSPELEAKCREKFAHEGIAIVDIVNSPSEVATSDLENAKDTYLRLIDRPFPLDTIVDLFKRHNYLTGVVEVCLKKALAIDRHQEALRWYRSDRDRDDKERRNIFDKRYQCYKYCFERRMLESKTAFDLMMSSSDELFHVCLFEYMRGIGELDRLLRCTSPFLRTFLQEKEPNYLWVYYKHRGEYAEAANNLMDMAEADRDESIDKRIGWLTEARNMAKLARLDELERSAMSKCRLAKIQKEMNERLDAANDGKLLSGQEVFDTCCRSRFWDLVILFISCHPLADQRKAIASAWDNLMQDQLWVCPSLADAQQEIITLAERIDNPDSEVLLPALVMPVLEEYRMQKKGNELWAVETMIKARIDKSLILSAYLNAWKNPDITESIKCDFSYAIGVLVHQGAKPQGQSLKDVREWFLTNGRRSRYYDEAFRLVAKL